MFPPSRCFRFLTADHLQPLSPPNRLVLETLDPLPGDRKCFRMINGVLVERTVKDVVPALQTNAEGLKKVLDDLVKQYKTKQDELEKWKVRLHLHTPSFSLTQAARAVLSVCRDRLIIQNLTLWLLYLMQKKNNVQVVQS